LDFSFFVSDVVSGVV